MTAPTHRPDVVDLIIRFESGDAEPDEILDLFAELIRSGTVWQLQGSYGRYANRLIQAGLVTLDGVITDEGRLFC